MSRPNIVAENFMNAFDEIMTSNEIDRVIMHTKGKEKDTVIKLKDEYLCFKEKNGKAPPFWAVLESVQSICLFKDIIAYMVKNSGGTGSED